MVNHRLQQLSQTFPSPDEAWWTSLLAEEERASTLIAERAINYYTAESRQVSSPPPPKSPSVRWDSIYDLYDRDETIHLPVTGHNRGGLLVGQNGLQGFVPLLHLITPPPPLAEDEIDRYLSSYIGQTLCLKVIECDPKRGRAVFSQRAAMAGAGRRSQLFETLTIGQCVHGTVTNITDFGVFVDIGGVEGLIHVSELSWGRVRHPADIVSVGQPIEAIVLSTDPQRLRVALSFKRLFPNPWQTAEKRYHVGQIVEVCITSIVSFGAFARLEAGLDGLIHISEMDLPAENPDPNLCVREGQTVRARILVIEAARQRLGLSLKLQG